MMIPENILAQALAQVFEGRPVGARMGFTEITQAWHNLGLRLGDLRDAIREMVERHCLTVQEDQGDLVFELTALGCRRFDGCRDTVPSPQDWLRQLREIQTEAGWNPMSEPWNRRAMQH
jgi:hypothetical protein